MALVCHSCHALRSLARCTLSCVQITVTAMPRDVGSLPHRPSAGKEGGRGEEILPLLNSSVTVDIVGPEL